VLDKASPLGKDRNTAGAEQNLDNQWHTKKWLVRSKKEKNSLDGGGVAGILSIGLLHNLESKTIGHRG